MAALLTPELLAAFLDLEEAGPRRICNWNRAHAVDLDMGPAEGCDGNSHGLCDECKVIVEKEWGL